MSAPIEAPGAPFDQGLAQGRALREPIRRLSRELRARYGPLAGWRARRRARARSGRPMQRFTPQMHERLRGIAEAAGVSIGVLELAEALLHVQGVASAKGTGLEGRLELPRELSGLLALRHSLPDAVGYPSAELVAAPFAGCLGGVNDQGLAVIVTEERGSAGPSMRTYAQDLLLRAPSPETGVDHLRLRAKLAGGNGALLALGPEERALRLELADGELQVSEVPHAGAPVAESTLVIDTGAHSLTWSDQVLCAGAD